MIAGSLLILLCIVAAGLGLVSLSGSRSLRLLSRSEKLALTLLFGLFACSFTLLMAVFAGFSLSLAWPVTSLIAGLVMMIFKRRNFSAIVQNHSSFCPELSPVLRIFFLIGAGVLLFWVISAALFLPTLDYDGLVIWSYRVRILLQERTLYTASLLDPVRIIAQPRHPYLITMMDLLFQLPKMRYSFPLMHFPLILIYLSYLCIGWNCARFVTGNIRKTILISSLVLLPAVPVELIVVSAREPIVAVFALTSIYLLCLWMSEGGRTFAIGSAICALMVQQAKIDGLPFAAGWVFGIVLYLSLSGDVVRRRDAWIALCVFLLSVPWLIVKRRIPASPMDPPFMSNYAALTAVRWRFVPRVLWMVMGELFLRPEVYGFAPHAALVALALGWRRNTVLKRLTVLAGPAAAAAAVFIIYVLRQGNLPVERNSSISRHLISFVPAMILAAWYQPAGSLKAKTSGIS
jgi:hypothetical protein